MGSRYNISSGAVAIHKHKDYWVDPETFNPQRWLDKEKVIDAYAFTPFSAGPRNCIGQHLALIESRIILSEFLMTFDFHIREDYELKMNIKFTYEAADDIKVDLFPKNIQVIR